MNNFLQKDAINCVLQCTYKKRRHVTNTAEKIISKNKNFCTISSLYSALTMTIKVIVFHPLFIPQIIWNKSSLYLFIKNSWNQTCFICRVSMCNVIINSAYLIHTHVADKLPFTYHILFWRHGPEVPPRFYFGNSIKKIKCFRFRFVPDVSFFFSGCGARCSKHGEETRQKKSNFTETSLGSCCSVRRFQRVSRLCFRFL